jgi:hypothetical protein
MSKMNGTLQKFLLALGILALLFLLVEIGASLAATLHGSTPRRVDHVTAGPYRFTVSLYEDPARAGFSLPFAIAPQGAASGSWVYHVTSVPQGTRLPNGRILIDGQYTATPISDSASTDPQVPGGAQGAAEISVQGNWDLQVVVDGPSGRQTFNVAIAATTIPAVPTWLGWALGFLPVSGIAVFLMMKIVGERQRVRGAAHMG